MKFKVKVTSPKRGITRIQKKLNELFFGPLYIVDTTSTTCNLCNCCTCQSTVSVPCCNNPVPQTLYVFLNNATGSCTCLNNTLVTMHYISGTNPGWSATGIQLCSVPVVGGHTFNLTCSTGTNSWIFTVVSGDPGACSFSAFGDEISCNPFALTFTNVPVSICCSGTIDVTITS